MESALVFPPDTLPLPLSDTMSLSEQKPILTGTPRKTSLPSSKATKPQHRVTKRTSSAGHHRDKMIQSLGMAGSSEEHRKSRVWKACERCRMKKTKCDGQFPCKRCTDDGIVCAAGHRRKVEFKQLPRGYAEVLESGQHALSATIIKLYKMIQAGESWTYGDVRLNDKNEPIIHDIAKKLNTIRAGHDLDVQVTNSMPQTDNEMGSLQDELWAYHKANALQQNGSQQSSIPNSAGHSPSPIFPGHASMPPHAGGMPPRDRQNSNSSADEVLTGTLPGNGWSQVQQQRPLLHSSSEVSSPGSLSLGWDSTPSAEIDWNAIAGLPGNSPISPQSGWDPAFAASMSRGNSFQGNNAMSQFSPTMTMPGSPSQLAIQQGGPMRSPYGSVRPLAAQQNGGLKNGVMFGQTVYNPMISGNFANLENDDGNGFNGL